MSAPSDTKAVVADTKTGEMVAAKRVGGGLATLSPASVTGGRRHKSRKISKKMMAKLKKLSAKQLKKALKGGEEAPVEAELEGARRRRHTRRRSHRAWY